jgi:hypothetical protein
LTLEKRTIRLLGFGLLLFGAWIAHFRFVWSIAPLPLLLLRIVLIVLSLFWVLAWRGALHPR